MEQAMVNDQMNEQALRTLHDEALDRMARDEAFRAVQRELALDEGYLAMKARLLYNTYQEAEDAYYMREAEAAGYSDYEGHGVVG